MIVHDPSIPERGGLPLSRVMGWNDAEMLAQQYITDLRACSGGIADYRIVLRRVFDEFRSKSMVFATIVQLTWRHGNDDNRFTNLTKLITSDCWPKSA
jgi:hypothetical protein